MRSVLALIYLLLPCVILSQSSPREILERAIAFHDPNDQWGSFKGEFKIIMQTPSSSERESKIALDLPKQRFTLDVVKDADRYGYAIDQDSCSVHLNGETNPKEEDRSRLRLSCERGTMFKNYYTYLYGLPMKLKDPGTLLHPKVEKRSFKGKEYLVLRVDYDKAVGEDRWYFYFDPKTYALEVYQFYHDEEKNDGEYILLTDLETINGIKMPKTRAWYYNKDNKYLGTDILNTLP